MCDEDDKDPPKRSEVQLEGTNVLDEVVPNGAFTVCLAGTSCTRDEGEVTRPARRRGGDRGASDKKIYCDTTGYIPVRIHREISGELDAVSPSVTVRGVGENDWAEPVRDSEPLLLDGPLDVPKALVKSCQSYSGKDQFSTSGQIGGGATAALALHAANLAAQASAGAINLIGHSRGGVEAIMAAWFLYAYGSSSVRATPVNIFAIDPVPGPGDWYNIMTQLAPNVAHYVGVYAWDMCSQTNDGSFQAVVPRPNMAMGPPLDDDKEPCATELKKAAWHGLAGKWQRQDPLKPSDRDQPANYELFACRGRHSTVAGNATSNSGYDPKDVGNVFADIRAKTKVDDERDFNFLAEEVKSVPKLVYRMARAYLGTWGVQFAQPVAVQETALTLRHQMNLDHRLFDMMGGGATRTSMRTSRPLVRRLSATSGVNPLANSYMDDVVGDPPYTMAYSGTSERTNTGWVKWRFL